MSGQCVVAVYGSLEAAKEAIRLLEISEIPKSRISLVKHSVERETPHPEDIQHGDQAEYDAAKGAGMGGVIGLLLGAPLLAIPGVGPILAAGPIAAGLTGAIVGGFLGSMAGWGVPEDHIANYEERVREGEILVVVDGEPDILAAAGRILQETDATSVDAHAETSADQVSP